MNIKNAQDQMKDNMLVKHYAGSLSYGTNLPTSDVDFRGIFVADPVHIRTPFFPLRQVTDVTEEDTSIHELSSFMSLALDCNPNIIETLWVDEQDIVMTSPGYQLLRQHAGELLSSKIAFTTSGYALSQLKRIKGHNKWIQNPQPEQQPQQVDFVSLVHNFSGEKMFKINLRSFERGYRLVPFSGDTYGLFQSDKHSPFNPKTGTLNDEYTGDTHTLGLPTCIVKYNKSEYNHAKDTWEHYWTWKKNRNEKRSELEEKYGYDTKHAMHLVRLLRMGAEALETGKLLVRRPDAAELLSIRNGAWSYEQIVQYAEEMDDRVRNKLYPTTFLPKKPNIKLASELVMAVQDMAWTKN